MCQGQTQPRQFDQGGGIGDARRKTGEQFLGFLFNGRGSKMPLQDTRSFMRSEDPGSLHRATSSSGEHPPEMAQPFQAPTEAPMTMSGLKTRAAPSTPLPGRPRTFLRQKAQVRSSCFHVRQIRMAFHPQAYGEEIARILALDGNGERLMPLAEGRCSSEEARDRLRGRSAKQWFPDARAPEASLSGLYPLFFLPGRSARDSARQSRPRTAVYWHGIMHRQEPDAANASYWFRRVGAHPIFDALAAAARAIASRYPDERFSPAETWDPFAFIDLCENARRRPGLPLEALATEIQRAEWQLLFDHCARPAR